MCRGMGVPRRACKLHWQYDIIVFDNTTFDEFSLEVRGKRNQQIDPTTRGAVFTEIFYRKQ